MIYATIALSLLLITSIFLNVALVGAVWYSSSPQGQLIPQELESAALPEIELLVHVDEESNQAYWLDPTTGAMMTCPVDEYENMIFEDRKRVRFDDISGDEASKLLEIREAIEKAAEAE